MPVAMALLRDVHNLCPKDVLNFILDLIKYNDNRKNKVCACVGVCVLNITLAQRRKLINHHRYVNMCWNGL